MAINDEAVPEPENPGSTGKQIAGPQDLGELLPNLPMAGVVNAIEGIVENRPRSLGSETAALLVVGTVNSLQADLQWTRKSLERCQKRNTDITEELAQLRVVNAKLETGATSSRESQTYSKLCMTAATLLAGLAVDNYKSGSDRTGLILTLLTVILVGGGWVIPRIVRVRK
ncbi:hypothetical protein [Stenotrophomonas sp. NPDC078853]|uniref:hypothetical protein n=1 Tax=Stenotrophomonas sp. NPDC078853 TaxID=3364534 RepID=UPI00384A7281